jgi:pimeloyl-ACP methyl ester carboxylesterase
MRAMFPKVRQLTVKGATHWVHTDAPQIIVEALRRFIRPLTESNRDLV